MYFNISVLCIVDTTSILKLVFSTAYCFCLDSHLNGCNAAIVVVVVIFSVILTVILIFFCGYCCC